jgi:hypothetical protein
MAARRQIFGDLMARSVAQPRQRHMRRVFAPLRLKPHSSQQPLLLGLQLHQLRHRLDGRDQRARLAAAERQKPVKLKFEGVALQPIEQASDFARQRIVDIADEAQRDVIIFRIDPARPGQAGRPPRMIASDSATIEGISRPVNKRGMTI